MTPPREPPSAARIREIRDGMEFLRSIGEAPPEGDDLLAALDYCREAIEHIETLFAYGSWNAAQSAIRGLLDRLFGEDAQ